MNKIGVFTSGGDSPGKYLVRNSKNISKQIMYKKHSSSLLYDYNDKKLLYQNRDVNQ